MLAARRPGRRVRRRRAVWPATSRSSPQGAVAVDGPALFLQGTILLLALPGVLAIAERSLDTGGALRARPARRCRAREHERAADRHRRDPDRGLPAADVRGRRHAAVPGGQRPADDVRRARGALAAAVPAVRAGPPPPAALAGGVAEVLPARRVLLGVLPVRRRAALRLRRHASAVAASPRRSATTRATRRCCSSAPRCSRSACCSRSAPCRSTPGRRTSTRARPTPITGFMAACTKVAAFGALLRVFYVGVGGLAWDWQPVHVGRRDPHHGGRLGRRADPDRRQADAGLLLDRARRASSSSAWSPPTRRSTPARSSASPACCSTCSPTASSTIGAFAVVTLVRDAAGEATHLSQWAGLAGARRWSPAVFAFFLLAFAGIPLTSGFTGKFAVFSRGRGRAAPAPLVVVGVVMSAVAAFFYVRVIVLMFFSDAGTRTGRRVAVPSPLTTIDHRARRRRSRWCSACCRPRSSTWPARPRSSSADARLRSTVPRRPPHHRLPRPTQPSRQALRHGLDAGRGSCCTTR